MGRSSDATVAQRVEDIFGLVVDGQPLRVIRQYVTDSCNWEADDRTLRRYMRRATTLIEKRSEEACEKARSTAIMRLERLYLRAVSKSDLRTALAVQQEIGRLHGINAPTRAELTGLDGAPLVPTTVEELAERFDELIRQQAKRLGKGGETEGGGSP
jgi:hypothetical protein